MDLCLHAVLFSHISGKFSQIGTISRIVTMFKLRAASP